MMSSLKFLINSKNLICYLIISHLHFDHAAVMVTDIFHIILFTDTSVASVAEYGSWCLQKPNSFVLQNYFFVVALEI